MDVFEAIKTRRSIREYQEREVEEEKLQKVLEAGRLAPSAKNIQEWRFVVVRDKETREKLARAARNQAFVAQAPVSIVGCAIITDYRMTCGQRAYPIDLAIAVDHMTLVAVEEGLGTCWIGSFFEDHVKEILGIPEEVRVVTLLTLGYSSFQPSAKPRLPKERIISYERWEW
jgi:nitroreductase